jgi:FkbM family methyltransferase
MRASFIFTSFGMSLFSKLVAYARAAAVQHGPNLRGLPLIPKSLCPDPPGNREAFNQFVLWIHTLQLSRVNRVVDVGANHGDFSLAASALYPKAQVLLVEPMPTLQPELERRCARRSGRWRLESCALGSQPGSATLHVDPNLDAIGSLVGFSEEYLKASPLAKEGQTLACTVRTLDDLCVDRGIDTIDLLKIDVEGFEFETLRGGARMLRATTALIIELSLVRRADGLRALEEMLEVLSSAGLHLVECYPSLYSMETPWLPVEFNLLARRPTP